jgi:putative transposase
MRANGWQGARRQKTVRPTIADPGRPAGPDLVDRQFTVPAPNRFSSRTSMPASSRER